MDTIGLGASLSHPGIDPRCWISFGVIPPDTEDARSVSFNDEDGNPLPFPIVAVTLQPKGTTIACRVSSGSAGAGEGEWSPFLAGDEVIVAIPHGDELGGGVILDRLNNVADPWPTQVAGADTTKNTVAFRRVRTPYILETAEGYLVRSATTGAQLGIDQAGQIIINDGDGSRIFLGADAVGITSASGNATIQVLNENDSLSLVAGDGTSLFLGDDATSLLVPGTFNVGTSGLPGSGHAVTLEQVLCIVGNTLCVLAKATAFSTTFNAGFLTGGPAVLGGLLGAVIAASASSLPMAAGGLPGGDMTSLLVPPNGIAGAIGLALQGQAPDPAALGLPTPVLPGLGRQGFLL